MWKWKDHFILIYRDLNNSYHNSAHFLKLYISLSVTEIILKEKAEGMETYSMSTLKFAVSQACLCCSPPCKSQGGGALSNSNSHFSFLLLCFLEIKCHVLDSEAAVEVGGSQDNRLQHYE